ncbi:MAG: hypothetical protein A3I04_04455 [Nitrospinae bacterium RIFCSPLOWO2_02_FULL_39_110]|nr:MAG: hypothetical protein A2W53_03445 [Nitrospinae bacterium RIFCSPHIGHO2_02_39_11]OGV99475.1 MAG: hypothetical protein A3D97_04965 [Nitrospinae bacterium RIFCSPHIGHO2_12_FULL_39_42]OGW00764.1 MAG: hypothetical protein A3D20_07455 [Nitrospinae bacterium RIFCSPHIGHO2_02_FULL_39_82]OGW01968.1 MAG: hypothetical protein A2Z59_00915 [Nitrospinae bacterium RIFCSPLOWO2_02_39_17]OGW05158.1 MAG: hypothetical protein A3I04_04455 [Nitrospinae bacterium RIFCSPLOWO2_02_FULL_39_110]OGW08586.1 MAG: hypoth
MRIVIIGGIAGGASAAAKARRINEDAEILLYEKGPHISFASCGLPYLISGEVKDEKSLLLWSAKDFSSVFNVKINPEHEVLKIDREKKKLEIKDPSGKTFFESYDRLILSPGTEPILPVNNALEFKNVFTLRSIDDAVSIKERLRRGRHITVIGSGFIGLEAVEALIKLKKEITLIEILPQVMPQLDPEMAGYIEEHLLLNKVSLILNDSVKEFSGNPVEKIILKSGKSIKTDLIIIGTGVRPNVRLARECGLKIGSFGGIEVNERMQTSDESIYACGDAVEVTNMITNKKTLIPLAGPAQRQGRVAGTNAAGGNLIYNGAIATFAVRVLNLIAGKTGLSEREAKREGLDYLVSYTHSPNHVGWFPEAKLMAVKVIFEKDTGRLLGAQIVGSDGVDKRIDIFATACRAGMTVYNLENLDLSYTPPFSSPKDPVNIASQVASNILRKDVEVMIPYELNGEYQVLDVLKAPMFLRDSISGAKNIPISKLRDRLGELENKKIAIYCPVGYTSYLAYRILKHHGFDVKNLSGGYETWKMFQKPEK